MDQPVYTKTIKLTNFADNSVVVRFRHYLWPVPQDHELANSDAALFKVIDRGKGRVALSSVMAGEYETVTGKRLMAEIRFQAPKMAGMPPHFSGLTCCGTT